MMAPVSGPALLRALGIGLSVPDRDDTGRPTRRWVLRGLDLDLHPGDQLALTGPSGAGKSTLLHLLAGLVLPEEGTLHSGDAQISTWPAARREAWRRAHVGLVFQQFHLFAGLSALENVLLPWSFDHLRVPAAARERAHELLRALDLGARAHNACERLSRGEQQRVAVARALVRSPALLLADEPTASLDVGHATETCSVLQDICRALGTALVVTTHDPAIAARLPRRLALEVLRA